MAIAACFSKSRDFLSWVLSSRVPWPTAMVTAVDTAIARIVSMLKKRKMLENSILIFTSDVSNPMDVNTLT